MESFFKPLKVDRIYEVRYETRAQARLDTVDWIDGYYNRERLHTSTGFLAPVDYEAALIAARSAVRGNEAGSIQSRCRWQTRLIMSMRTAIAREHPSSMRRQAFLGQWVQARSDAGTRA
jgi:hypothetical protein